MNLLDKLKVPEFDAVSLMDADEFKKSCHEDDFLIGASYQHSLLTKEIALRNRVIEKLIEQMYNNIGVLHFNGLAIQDSIDEMNKELETLLGDV